MGNSHVSRRRFLQLVATSAAAVPLSGLLAACGGDAAVPTSTTGSNPGAASTGTTAAGTTPAPAHSETGTPAAELIVAVGADSYRTEPERANIGMYPLNTNIFESLVQLTPDYQIEPLLAESWEFVEPNTWRFRLRRGVRFHDGTPFSAEAVQWSMSRIAKTGGGVLGVDENSVKIVDDHTVEITPARPNRRLIQQLNHPSNSIIAPNSQPLEKRIGTGPYREVEYAKESHYIVEANLDYWGDAPKTQRIRFRFMPDGNARVLALQSGEVHIAVEVPRESAQELTNKVDLALVTSKVGAYEALYVNIRGDAPYDLGQDKAVREAVAWAIDKDAIVNGVWQGNAEISNSMIPPGILGSPGDQLKGTTYDPARANQILDEAGWSRGAGGIREKEGRRLKLSMIVGYPNAQIHTPMPEFVQAQLQEVGIELEIVQTPDTATYEARLQTGEGDLWAEAGSQNDGNPCFLPDLLFYSPDPNGDPESQMYGNAFAPGPAFDSLIDDCRAAVTAEEVQAAAARAMQLLIDQEFVVIPLAGTYRLAGASAKVGGFEAHPSGVNQRWTEITVAS